MGEIKSGYYWAYDPNREHDIIVRVSESGVASDMILHNTDACSDAEIKQRIPTAEELGEWTDEPTCPVCGTNLHIWNDDDGEEGICPIARCYKCHRDFILEARYRVVEE